MGMRGVRGAITVEQNEKEAIWQAAKAMMQELIERNELAPEDIGAVIFSMTEDLTAAFPTAGAKHSARRSRRQRTSRSGMAFSRRTARRSAKPRSRRPSGRS